MFKARVGRISIFALLATQLLSQLLGLRTVQALPSLQSRFFSLFCRESRGNEEVLDLLELGEVFLELATQGLQAHKATQGLQAQEELLALQAQPALLELWAHKVTLDLRAQPVVREIKVLRVILVIKELGVILVQQAKEA